MAIRGNNGSVAIFISKFIKQGAPEVRGRGKWSRKGVGEENIGDREGLNQLYLLLQLPAHHLTGGFRY